MKLWPEIADDDDSQYYPDNPWYNDAYIVVAEDGCLTYNSCPCLHGSYPVDYEE
mgnify:FL=1